MRGMNIFKKAQFENAYDEKVAEKKVEKQE